MLRVLPLVTAEVIRQSRRLQNPVPIHLNLIFDYPFEGYPHAGSDPGFGDQRSDSGATLPCGHRAINSLDLRARDIWQPMFFKDESIYIPYSFNLLAFLVRQLHTEGFFDTIDQFHSVQTH